MLWHTHRLFAFGSGTLLSLVLAVLISGIFMWIGARLAGIQRATLGRAIFAAISGTAIVWLVGGLLATTLPLGGSILGFLVILLLVLVATRIIFDTSFGKALLAWIFFILAQAVVGLLVSLLFTGSIRACI
jgi:hypothetical protein